MPCEIARSAPKRKEEFFHGRVAACYALAAMNRHDHDAACPSPSRPFEWPSIGIGAHHEPIWPSGVVGSISHCSGLAASAVSSEGRLRGLGIDIEHVAGPDAIAALKQVVLDSAELECLHAATSHWPLELLLTAAFSAKESFYKGAFNAVGRFFGFEAVRLRFVDEQRQRLRFTVTQPLAAPFPLGHSFEVSFDTPTQGTVLTHFAW